MRVEKCEAIRYWDMDGDRHLRPHLPPSTNSAIIYKCVVMYFCTGHGINRIMCVADAERIGA